MAHNIEEYPRFIFGKTALDEQKVLLVDAYGRPITILAPREFMHRLADGNLTSDGIQWSSEVSTVDANTDYEVLNLTLDNDQVGNLVKLEPALTLAIKAGSTTADVKFKWQARNKAGTWVDLHDYVTLVDVGTSYVESTVSGYKFPATNLDSYPIDIRLVIQSNEVSPGIATAEVKNSSYVKIELK